MNKNKNQTKKSNKNPKNKSNKVSIFIKIPSKGYHGVRTKSRKTI